jgi:hypothetical protein
MSFIVRLHLTERRYSRQNAARHNAMSINYIGMIYLLTG